jgi:hypothetical protein
MLRGNRYKMHITIGGKVTHQIQRDSQFFNASQEIN